MRSLLAAMALGVFCSSSSAAVFTNDAAFLAEVQGGWYLEDFSSVADGSVAALNFSGNGFAYTISAVNGLYNEGGVISVDVPSDALDITFTSGNVTAVGGNFWVTDDQFSSLSAQITISLSDGTVESFTATGPSDFRGFTSTSIITSMTIASGSNDFPTLDNLYVGQMIPEPAVGALVLLALAALGHRRRFGRGSW